jgi:hypothetical protein
VTALITQGQGSQLYQSLGRDKVPRGEEGCGGGGRATGGDVGEGSIPWLWLCLCSVTDGCASASASASASGSVPLWKLMVPEYE